jgi:hypothetical protein
MGERVVRLFCWGKGSGRLVLADGDELVSEVGRGEDLASGLTKKPALGRATTLRVMVEQFDRSSKPVRSISQKDHEPSVASARCADQLPMLTKKWSWLSSVISSTPRLLGNSAAFTGAKLEVVVMSQTSGAERKAITALPSFWWMTKFSSQVPSRNAEIMVARIEVDCTIGVLPCRAARL